MSKLILLALLIVEVRSHDRVPPMVPPSHYEQNQNIHHPPPPQAQGFGGQAPPVQYAHQQQPVQPHPPHAGQAGSGQHLLHGANLQHEKEHIAEHMDIPIDTSKMSEQELQFHYFKMHDNDNNNKLDGTELIKSLIHWHETGHDTPQGQSGQHGQQQPPPPKLFTDEELIGLIDPILKMDDMNGDGYIDYSEFIRAQQKAASNNH